MLSARRLEGLTQLASRGATPGERAAARAALLKHAEVEAPPAPAPVPTPEQGTYAEPCKWRGGWAARCDFKVRVGDVVTVRARSTGKTWDARVIAVVHHRDGISTVTTGPADAPLPRHTRGMSLTQLQDLLTALAGRQAMLDAQAATKGWDRKQRRQHFDRLIMSLTGKPPR